MIDIRLVRTNPELVKENIRKKFQDEKLVLVDEVLDLDKKFREARTRCDELRAQRNSISKEIGKLYGQGKKDEAEAAKAQVAAINEELSVIRSCQISRSPTTWISWKDSPGSIWILPATPAVMASITLRAT